MTCLWSKHATRVHAVVCARGLHANLVESDVRAAASRVPLSTASRPYVGRETATGLLPQEPSELCVTFSRDLAR